MNRSMLVVGVGAAALLACAPASSQDSVGITVAEPAHGALRVEPAPGPDGRMALGTRIGATASPAEGFVLDSVYYAAPGRFGLMYYESMSNEIEVSADRDLVLGALFLPRDDVPDLDVRQNVVYARPGVKPLKYDIFATRGARGLPIVVIIHGGGWTANTEDIMRGMAREIAKTGRYVVASIDYRWAGTADGDSAGNDMADLIGDVFGAIAHIQEHARAYGGDGTRIAVTGDSAGGHLSAVAATMSDMIGDGGFGDSAGVFEFLPSYVPDGMTLSELRDALGNAIRAAAPSYGVFSEQSYNGSVGLSHQSADPRADASWAAAIAPIHHIPAASARPVPHYLTRGTQDPLISDAMVAGYADALRAQGQVARYDRVEGASHAFFDWKPDPGTRATFARFGVPYVAEMVGFFDEIFYP